MNALKRAIAFISSTLLMAACGQADYSSLRSAVRGNDSPSRDEQLNFIGEEAGKVNVAYGKPTQQSSEDWGGASGRAVDGRTNGDYSYGSVTHTRLEYMPWWQVDLGDDVVIKEIRIWNRTDCCKERLDNFTVTAIDSAGATAFRSHERRRPTPSSTINTGEIRARYVKIQLTGWNYLSLAEVEVMGFPNSVHLNNKMIVTGYDKCLDVWGASYAPQAEVRQFDCHGGSNQRFNLTYLGNDLYRIVAAHSGKCLTIARDSKKNGAQLQQEDCSGRLSQIFRIVDRAGDTFAMKPYHAFNPPYSQCVNVLGKSDDSGAAVGQWDCHGGRNQRFRFR